MSSHKRGCNPTRIIIIIIILCRRSHLRWNFTRPLELCFRIGYRKKRRRRIMMMIGFQIVLLRLRQRIIRQQKRRLSTSRFNYQKFALKRSIFSADIAQATAVAAAKIESLKKWTVNTYKTTRHTINEQLGKVTRTVDKELHERIESLRELHRCYQEVLAAALLFVGNFDATTQSQRNFADLVYRLSAKEDALKVGMLFCCCVYNNYYYNCRVSLYCKAKIIN